MEEKIAAELYQAIMELAQVMEDMQVTLTVVRIAAWLTIGTVVGHTVTAVLEAIRGRIATRKENDERGIDGEGE